MLEFEVWCCWNFCNIWPKRFTSLLSHYCLYFNGIPEFVGKRLMLTVNKLKQPKIFKISLSESRIYKKWQTSAIIREISDSNLDTGRNGLKSGVSRIIRESWRPCNKFKINVWQMTRRSGESENRHAWKKLTKPFSGITTECRAYFLKIMFLSSSVTCQWGKNGLVERHSRLKSHQATKINTFYHSFIGL